MPVVPSRRNMAVFESLHGSFADDVGHTVTFDIYSLGSAVPGLPGEQDMCLRYELKNTSTQHTIHGFRWPDNGLPYYGFPISPQQQPPGWVTKPHNVEPDPDPDTTTVGAFNRASATVQALFAVRRVPVKASDLNVTSTSYRRPFDAPNELALALVTNRFDAKPTVGILVPDVPFLDYPALSYDFKTTDEVAVSMESDLQFIKESFELKYTIDASPGVQVIAPLIGALQELHPSPTVDDAIQIVNTIDAFIDVDLAHSETTGIDIKSDPAMSDFGDQAVFIVETPVTIRSKYGDACLMYQVYSPVPVPVPADRCALPKEVLERLQ